MKFITARLRLTCGLVSIVISALLLSSVVGILPDHRRQVLDGRATLFETVAVNASIMVTIGHHPSSNQSTALSVPPTNQAAKLRLPARDASKIRRVQNYLTQDRNLEPLVLDSLIETGKLYADNRGNAVFLMVTGKANHPVGAELRGTGKRVWRGMAPGSRKDSGYFWIGAKGRKRVVLCESAIDAISCYMLYPDRVCISTAGARPNPPWLPVILDHGYEVACGFDADPPGDAASQEMIRLYPNIRRLRPVAKDWNLVLTPVS